MSIIVIAFSCMVIATFWSGEMAKPKGSCVIRILFPAGVTYRPLGKIEYPFGSILAISLYPGTDK